MSKPTNGTKAVAHTCCAEDCSPCSDSQDYSMYSENRPETGVAAAQTEVCMLVMHFGVMPAMAKSIEKRRDLQYHAKLTLPTGRMLLCEAKLHAQSISSSESESEPSNSAPKKTGVRSSFASSAFRAACSSVSGPQ
jgi:hypothetical protein